MVKLGKVITIVALKKQRLYVWLWWPYQLIIEWFWKDDYHRKTFTLREGGDRWEL